jgi:hypothetical protein
VGDVWDGIGNGHGKCRKYVDGAFALSGAVSSALPGTLRHVIDLHAQAPVFFYPYCTPVSHSVYSSRRVPLLYSITRLAISPHAQVREKEDKCVLIERPCRGLGGPASLGFWFNQRAITCVARNGDAAFSDHRFCSFSFAVRTWPLTDILSTHKRTQWYTRVTLDPHTGCHCMRQSQ